MGVVAAVVALIVAVIVALMSRGGTDDASGPKATASRSATPAPAASPSKASPGAKRPQQPKATSTRRPKVPIPREAEPVPVDESVETDRGVRLELVKRESVRGKARFAGEISGPAIRVTLRITNGSRKPMDLGYVVVNAYSGNARTPAPPIAAPGGTPMTGTLQPGRSATGVYLFSVGTKRRMDMTIGVDHTPGQPTAVFRGAFAR